MNLSIQFTDKLDLPDEFNTTNYSLNNTPLIPEKEKNNNYSSLRIKDISKVNFFIGANNSGKSRFLRGVFKIEKRYIEIHNNDLNLIEQVHSIKNTNEEIYEYRRHKYNNLLNAIGAFIYILGLENKSSLGLISQNLNFQKLEEKYNHILNKFSEIRLNSNTLDVRVNDLVEETKILYSDLKLYNHSLQKNKIYIPVLRYANSNDSLKDQTYKQLIKENYGVDKDVFTGLSLSSDIRKLQGSKRHIRRRKKEFEGFLSKNFFNNKSVEITASSENSNEIYFDINEEERKLFNLGDGLQSIILLMYPIYTADENTWIFIDEPENHLHPGFQKIFLRTILEDEYLQSKNLQYFITTHSNHFLDDSIRNENISIFQFEKNENLSISIEYLRKPSKNTLDILGVSNASVLISNSSIWVEGPTDRYYLSYFLDRYSQNQKNTKLLEDIDFAFFEYGGNLIAHYLFDDEFKEDDDEVVREQINSFALSNHIYLLADDDNASGRTKRGKRRKELEKLSEENVHFKYQNTKVVEIENLLPPKVILDFAKELIEKDEIEKIQHLKIERENYSKIRLGDFYEKLFDKNSISKNRRKFKAESGTLKAEYKIKLSDFVISKRYSYEELIEENKILDTIVSELYSFIIEQK